MITIGFSSHHLEALTSRQWTASSWQRDFGFRISDFGFKKSRRQRIFPEGAAFSRDWNSFYDFNGFNDLNDFNDSIETCQM